MSDRAPGMPSGERAPARHDLSERLAALKEKAEILRRGFLASPAVGGGASKERWVALPRLSLGASCPRCGSALRPVPPTTMVLLACPACGFVAKRCLIQRN